MNPSDPFERQLRSLVPEPHSVDSAEVMYACGFAAGQASQAASNGTESSRHWLRTVAAILMAAIAAAGGGYGMGAHRATERLVANMPQAGVEPDSRETVVDRSEVTASTSTSTSTSGNASRNANGVEKSPEWLRYLVSGLAPARDSDVETFGPITLTARTSDSVWERWLKTQDIIPTAGSPHDERPSDRSGTTNLPTQPWTPMSSRDAAKTLSQWIQ